MANCTVLMGTTDVLCNSGIYFLGAIGANDIPVSNNGYGKWFSDKIKRLQSRGETIWEHPHVGSLTGFAFYFQKNVHWYVVYILCLRDGYGVIIFNSFNSLDADLEASFGDVLSYMFQAGLCHQLPGTGPASDRVRLVDLCSSHQRWDSVLCGMHACLYLDLSARSIRQSLDATGFIGKNDPTIAKDFIFPRVLDDFAAGLLDAYIACFARTGAKGAEMEAEQQAKRFAENVIQYNREVVNCPIRPFPHKKTVEPATPELLYRWIQELRANEERGQMRDIIYI
eukprot:tig00020531_g10030.t1